MQKEEIDVFTLRTSSGFTWQKTHPFNTKVKVHVKRRFQLFQRLCKGNVVFYSVDFELTYVVN